MGKRDDASGRVDPKRIGSDQFDPKDLSNRRTIDTLLPYMLVFNGDSIIHTITLEFRQGNGPSVTTTFTIAAGGACGLPTLPFAAIASDSAGTPSSVKVCYSDIEPAGFKTAAGGGNSIAAVGVLQIASASSRFQPFAGTSNSGSANHALVETEMLMAGTVKNLTVIFTDNTLNGNLVITLYKNGVATALSVTVAGGSTARARDTTHSVTFVSGDLLAWFIDATAAAAGVADLNFNSQVGA